MEQLLLELPQFPIMSCSTPVHRESNRAPFVEKSKIISSSDLWVTDSSCVDNCNGINTFNPAQSSSLTNLSTPFAIKYGSGAAQGFLVKDVVQLAGFSVQNQVFGRSPFSASRKRP